MIRTSRIKGGDAARVDYYLRRATADEYAVRAADRDEARTRYYSGHTANGPGRWLGRGADALALTDQAIDAETFRAAVLDGYIDGAVRVKPRMETSPAGRTAAEPWAQAVRALAESRGVDPVEMGRSGGARTEWGQVSRAADKVNESPAGMLAKIGRAVGIDPREIYGRAEWDHAVRMAGTMVDTRLAAVDITMTADKSVSLLYATGDDATRAVILHEFHEANRSALGHLDTITSDVRRGSGSTGTVERQPSDGLIAVGFVHDEARPTAGCQCGDPHLHEHVITLNTVRGRDGKWSAAQIDDSASAAKTAGHLQEAEMRVRLRDALGVEWRPVVNGLSDVVGVSDEAIRAFSKRSDDVEAEQREAGTLGTMGDQVANHATRLAKGEQLSVAERVDYWRADAATIGLDPAAALDRAPGRSQGKDQDSRAYAADILEQLTEESSSFNRSDLLRVLADDCRQGERVDVVTRRADCILSDPKLVVALAPGEAGLTRGDVRQSAGGIRAYAVEAKWTTPEMLDLERQLVEAAVSRQGTHIAKLDGDLVEALIERAPFTLSAEQVAAVRGLTTSGNGVEVLHAGAGSGKTSAVLGTVRQLSLIHISEPTRLGMISYAVFCLKK